MGSPPRRKEIPLNGPRPAALSVAKDSLKIKKPPLPPSRALQLRHHHQQRRQPPLVIYELSPQVKNVPAADFMAYVQQQTGYHPSAAAAASTSSVDVTEPEPTTAPHSPPGILSPTPTSLPSISPNIFTPTPTPPPPPPDDVISYTWRTVEPPPLPTFNQNPVHLPYGLPNFSPQDFFHDNSFPDNFP
ncbi:protein MKS1-like [Momordica charantia]|uniref:Protein MKS1-like n=1 Tax=Momordica charantia TaxID=3673 RepID=A0A6J1CL52_MOMCH|nr:protein MKS1-like [Momordica charantia]